MEYDLINFEAPLTEGVVQGNQAGSIFLTLWRNPFVSMSNEKIFAPDMFANFTISLSGLDTEYNFSKSVISGLSNRVCQILINQPNQSEGIVDLQIDPPLFHKAMQLLAGVPRVEFFTKEMPQLYCLMNYLDIFDNTFKQSIIAYLLKNTDNSNILEFIQVFETLHEKNLLDDLLEKLVKLRFEPLKDDKKLATISSDTFEKILDFHQNQRMKFLFADEAGQISEDYFLSEKELETVILSYVENCVHYSGKVIVKNRLFERFIVKDKKVEVEERKEDKSISILQIKNEELEGRVAALTLQVTQQQKTIDTHSEQIQKLHQQIESLLLVANHNKSQNVKKEEQADSKDDENEELFEYPDKLSIQRATKLTNFPSWKHEGIIDAVCLQADSTVKLVGIETCLPGEVGSIAAGEISIYEWDYFELGQLIAQFSIVLDFTGEKSAPFWLSKNIVLRSGQTYCITSRMFGGPTYASETVKPYVKEKGVEVVFIEPDALAAEFRIGSYIFPGFYLEKIK